MLTHRSTFYLIIILIWQSLIGCTKVGPEYIPPEPVTPATWQAPIEGGIIVEAADRQLLAEWWTILKDPLLAGFIHQAITGNLDLEQARARLMEARAKRDLSSAALLPTLNVSGSVTKNRRNQNSASGNQSTTYAGGFDAGWEIDLFGGGRRSVEAAQARLEASREDLRDVLVSLLAEVALNYIEVRSLQIRLQIAGDNLTAQEETFALTNARYQSGLVSELAVQQARYLVAGTRAKLPALRTSLAQATNLLTVLLGLPPGALTAQFEKTIPLPNLPTLPPSVAIGIPAETLQRRPDIRKAERQLAAQTAEIGAAASERYPALRLSGSIGLDALSVGKLFRPGSSSYSFGPSVNWPIFDTGAIEANIQLQTFLQQETLAAYKATVLAALAEVEDALTAYAQEQETYQALQESANAARQASTLADIQYQAGLINFTEVLDARRSLLSYQDQLTQSAATMTGNLIRLYKALGGGWTSLALESNTLSGK